MKKEIDYYGNEANVIHLKFGDCRKHYNFTSEFIRDNELFTREYDKYFNYDSRSQFKNPFQIVHYVYKNEIPVHFYYNFTDTPAKDEQEIMEYLTAENSYIGELK